MSHYIGPTGDYPAWPSIPSKGCEHAGSPVQVGPYTVLAGGTRDLRPKDLDKATILVPLTRELPGYFGGFYVVLWAPLVDFGGVPEEWRAFLEETVVPLLREGEKLLAYCVGSHGRTGTFLASLIALVESEEETPDPIAAVRERHCSHAVETKAQAEAVFAIRGQSLPQKYVKEFAPRPLPKGSKGDRKGMM